MSAAVNVRKVETPEAFKAFFAFPWTLYKNDPNWVPPLVSMRRDLLNKKKNPAWEYLEGEYYAAWRGEQIVGTIVPLVNHNHNQFHNEQVAWFGLFECYNDAEVAHALLNTAREWARAHQVTALRGPQSFTTHEETGLLVEGFERPVMLMPYNPPYYQGLLQSAGFRGVMDTHSYYYDWTLLAENNTEARLEKLIARIKRTHNVTVRPINRRNLRADFETFKDIYNDAWEKNWGFVPMTPKELDALIESLSAFFDPNFACFAEVDGKPVGFMLGVPDFNQVLQLARPHPGEPEPITLVKALWHWKLRPKITRLRIPLMGVREAYRKKGFDLLMFQYFLKALRESGRIQYLDCGWILETNQDMAGTLKGIGLTIHRTYRYYEVDV